MAGRPDLAGRASQRASDVSAGSGSGRQPDPAGQGDDGAPPRPAPAPCAAWRGPGMVWTVGVGSGEPLRGRVPALLKKWGPYQPNLEDYWRHMTTKQARSRSNASRCIRCGHGGGSLGGCMGEYRRARGSLHVRGPLWLRSQVPIRRPKGHSFTQDEDIICYYIIVILISHLSAVPN
eukprot:COSAG01_NODE_20116_length_969_cov_10.208046_2_plen_177_part_00